MMTDEYEILILVRKCLYERTKFNLVRKSYCTNSLSRLKEAHCFNIGLSLNQFAENTYYY